MERLLSSKWTFFYKRIYPVAWILLCGVVAAFLWTTSCSGLGGLRGVVLIVFVGGSLFSLWYSSRLKQVWLRGDRLVVTDFRTEEEILITDVIGVRETRLWNPKLICLILSRPSKWGDEIVFMAPVRFSFVFLNHPLVNELREMIAQRGGGCP